VGNYGGKKEVEENIAMKTSRKRPSEQQKTKIHQVEKKKIL
jgi:hypothetical protein